MAFDPGSKRIGLAVTDPHQIIATGLCTLEHKELMPYLKKYVTQEGVGLFVMGDPRHLDNTPAQSAPVARQLADDLKKQFPEIELVWFDERFTSKMAFEAMLAGGLNRKQRANKAMIDKVSATILLQNYLEAQSVKNSRA